MASFSCVGSKLNMSIAPYYLPKSNRRKPLGEDAFFICDDEQTMGVADGVGGWEKRGIDAGKYSRELLANVEDLVWDETGEVGVNLKRILAEAFRCTTAKGSSTACIVSLEGEFLHCVNVGDSRFVIIRDGKVVFSSPVQTKAFNHPYQLGRKSDSPDDALEFTCLVEPGDAIVLGTDGLFDNVFEEELETLVYQGLLEDLEPKRLAKRIAILARKKALNPYSSTPFEAEAKRAGFENIVGGKYDDITVLIGLIS